MRHFSTLLFLFFFLITSRSYSQAKEFNVNRADFFFTLQDSTLLDCTRYYPVVDSVNKAGWPVVIFIHGYGSSKESLLSYAEQQSKYGYITYAFSMRGHGRSTGLSNLISTVEMNDLMQFVNFVRKDSVINTSRIGLIGSSQGGIIPFMAACSGLKVRCIVSDLGTPDFASNWIENGCIKMTLVWSVNYDTNKVRYNGFASSLKDWILSDDEDKWDSISYYLPQGRDFTYKLQYCQVPILLSNSWQDKFFNTSGVMKNVRFLQSPFKVYYGAVAGHGSDITEDENNFHARNVSQWFELWLKDASNTILDSGRASFAATTFPLVNGQWSYIHYSNLDEGLHENIKFYFHPDNKLHLYPNNKPDEKAELKNEVDESYFDMRTAINEGFKGEEFNKKFKKNSIDYDSEPLDKDYHITGVPVVHLYYTSNEKVCQYNFQIWEVTPDNQSNLVTRVNYTDRKNTPTVLKETTIEGLAHSHIFRAGNKIRVRITNLDNTDNDKFLGTNPYVLPVIKDSKNYVFMNSKNRTSIELPLTSTIFSSRLYQTDFKTINYKLYDIYSIPYQDCTKVMFDVYRNFKKYVSVKIYDLDGGLVEMLNDKELSSGAYNANWDGKNKPAGVYFCRMDTDGYNETKRFVLIK